MEAADLLDLFLSEPLAATKYATCYLACPEFESVDEFFEHYKKRSAPKTCQEFWTRSRLAIHCYTCSLDDGSCLCLNCFLNSNHEGHNYSIHYSGGGNCDCGDKSLWKEEGFCSAHPGASEHPEEEVDEEARKRLADVLHPAIKAFLKLTRDSPKDAVSIMDWLMILVGVGDGFRRTVALAWMANVDFPRLLLDLFDFTPELIAIIVAFMGRVINDSKFCLWNSISTHNALVAYAKEYVSSKNDRSIAKKLKPMRRFFFHAFSPAVLLRAYREGIDWVNIYLDTIDVLIESFVQDLEAGRDTENKDIRLMNEIIQTAKVTSNSPEQRENFLRFYEGYLKILQKQDARIKFVYLNGTFDDDEVQRIRRLFAYSFSLLSSSWDFALKGAPFTPLIDALRASFNNLDDIHLSIYGGAEIVLTLPLHFLFWRHITNNEIVTYNMDDDFLLKLAVRPLRFIAAALLANSRKMLYNEALFENFLLNFYFRSNIKYSLSPIYAVLQFCLVNIKDKDALLSLIFEVFDVDNHPDDINFPLLVISCLLLDRNNLRADEIGIVREVFTHLLHTKSHTYSELIEAVWPFPNTTKVDEMLCDIAVSNRNNKDNVTFKLKDDNGWSPIRCWLSPIKLNESVAVHLQSRNTRVPFPAFQMDDLAENLGPVLGSPLLHRYLHKAMSLPDCVVGGQLALNLLLLIHKLDYAKDIAHQEYDGVSFLTLCENLGSTGLQTLSDMHIGYHDKNSGSDSSSDMEKNHHKQVINRVKDEFKAKQNLFQLDGTENIEENEVCSVCMLDDEEEILGYPLYTHMSGLPAALGLCDRIPLLGFHLCPHPVHGNCVAHNTLYACPYCGSRRNTVLGNYKSFFFTEKEKESATIFVNVIKNTTPYWFTLLIRSYIAYIQTYEIYFRIREDCFEKTEFALILRNLFILLWDQYRSQEDELWKERIPDDPFFSFMLELFCDDTAEFSNYHEIMQKHYASFTEPKLQASFLRFAFILEYFALQRKGETDSKWTDWDALLDLNRLASYFNVSDSISSYELPVVRLINFPPRFIDLGNDKYRFPIQYHDEEYVLDVLSGVPYSTRHIGDLVENTENTPRLLLYLSGRRAKECTIFIPYLRFEGRIPPLYVTSLGEADIGFRTGRPSRLSAYGDDRAHELLMTHSWIDTFS